MEVEIHDQNPPLNKVNNDYTPGKSNDCDFGEDITDLLQLDDIIDEGTVIEDHRISEISPKVNLHKKKKKKTSSLKITEEVSSPILSTEEVDQIFNALVNNKCEKNGQDDGLQCKSCGFYSENVKERIEHLKSERHSSIPKEIKNAIKHGILESYTINTFYCTICSWFVTDFSSIIEHIFSSKHKDLDLISRHKIPGVLMNSFCYICKSILCSNKEICNHISDEHDCIYYYFEQQTRHVMLKMTLEKTVFCAICKFNIRFAGIEEHLNSHGKVCFAFNENQKCSFLSSGDCHLSHKCLFCKKDHPLTECPNNKAKTICVLEDPLNGGISRFVKFDPLVLENKNISKVQKGDSYISNKNEYESNASKKITKTEVQNRSDEKTRKAVQNFQGSKVSRSPTKNSSSKSSSHRSNNNSKSEFNNINERENTKETHSRNIIGNIKEIISSSDLGFIDEEELNVNTAIVKLLEICNLLGNLGYFFAIILKKTLENKESEEDILNILRENANIILMEVIIKKLTCSEIVHNRSLYVKIQKGIKYIRYLLNVSKSS